VSVILHFVTYRIFYLSCRQELHKAYNKEKKGSLWIIGHYCYAHRKNHFRSRIISLKNLCKLTFWQSISLKVHTFPCSSRTNKMKTPNLNLDGSLLSANRKRKQKSKSSMRNTRRLRTESPTLRLLRLIPKYQTTNKNTTEWLSE
jgi:hypothetical protein